MDVAHVSSLGLGFAKNLNLHHEFLPTQLKKGRAFIFNEMPFGFSGFPRVL
jgi:hypothetical protein